MFTERGAVMLASVLNSQIAVDASIEVARTFIKFRQMILQQSELVHKLDQLEKKYNVQFKVIFDAVGKLMEPSPKENKRQIGFKVR